MSKEIYVVDCYTCQHNGQETCKGCNTLLNGDVEPYENWELREDLSQKDQHIAELEQQLAELKEKDNYHLRYELAGADETITNLKKQLAEKVKEIELLKHLGSHETNMELFKENTKLIIEKRQFAIQELEKVKILIQNAINFERPNFVEVYDALNEQIKELKGE